MDGDLEKRLRRAERRIRRLGTLGVLLLIGVVGSVVTHLLLREEPDVAREVR
jgi:hypothetical protein